MIQEHLSNRTGLLGSAEHSGFQRPVLVLLDRGVDVPIMMHHPWTYHAMAADLFEVRLNHVTIEADPAKNTPRKTYDVDSSDIFWAANSGRVYHEVAEDVDVQIKKYKTESEDLQRRTGMDPGADVVGAGAMAAAGGDDKTKELSAAMSLLPEMQERKRRLDIHFNLASSLLGQIKARDLQKYHKLEQAIIMRQTLDSAELNTCILGNEGKGKVEDRVRLFLIYYLCSEIPEAELAQHEAAFAAEGADLRALQYLKRMKAINNMSASAGPGQSANSESTLSGLSKMWGSGFDKASNLVAGAVKNLIPVGDQLAATRLVEAIMEQKSTPEADAFVYLDPKARAGTARVTAPFKESIVFVVGGGNYTEYQNLQDSLSDPTTGRTVVYGATELCSAESYLSQLSQLGGGAQ